MKFSEIKTKQDKLLAYLYAYDDVVRPDIYFSLHNTNNTNDIARLVELGVMKDATKTNILNLRATLDILCLKGFVKRIAPSTYQITEAGRDHIYSIAMAIDDYSEQSLVCGMPEDDEPEDENDEQDSEDEVHEDPYKAVFDAIKTVAAAIELVAKTIGH